MRRVFKKLLPLTLAFTMILSTNTFAKTRVDTNTQLQTAYERVISYATDNNIPVNMTFNIFVSGYTEQAYSDVQSYEEVYYSLLRLQLQPKLGARSSSFGGDKAWYYNKEKDVSIYRVTSANGTDKENAVNFCVGELGSSYSLDFAKDTSSSETDWYCSELVWAAYKNQSINIETTATINEPGVTPRDIRGSSKVNSVSFD